MISAVNGNAGIRIQDNMAKDTTRIESEIRRLEDQINKIATDDTKKQEEKQKRIMELRERILQLEQMRAQGGHAQRGRANSLDDSRDKPKKNKQPRPGWKPKVDIFI